MNSLRIPVTRSYEEPFPGFFRRRNLPFGRQDRETSLLQAWQIYFAGLRLIKDQPEIAKPRLVAVKMVLPAVTRRYQNIFASWLAETLLRPLFGKISREGEAFHDPSAVSISCGLSSAIYVQPVPLIHWSMFDQINVQAVIDHEMNLLGRRLAIEVIWTDLVPPIRKNGRLDKVDYPQRVRLAYQTASFTI